MHSVTAFAKTTAIRIHNQDYAPWQVLNEAYERRGDHIIDEYSHSGDSASNLYARALKELIDEDVDQLQQIGRSCLGYKVKTNDEAAALFGCLFAVAAGAHQQLGAKAYISWLAKVKNFYKTHKSAIDAATNTDDPAHINSIKVPVAELIKKWPRETVSINDNWTTIPLNHGTVYGFVDGVRIPLIVDTGTSSGIYLSKAMVKRLGIAKYLVPLKTSFGAGDNTGGMETDLFVATHFRMGPINVQNVYVNVGPGDHSYIGLYLLRPLGSFAITSNKIRREALHAAVCGGIRQVRMPVTQAFTYPFLDVRVNGGTFGLFLDSGMRIRAQGRYVAMYMSHKGVSQSDIDVAGRRRRVGEIVIMQHGKLKKFNADRYDITIAGLPISAWSAPGLAFVTDPAIDGVLAYGFLERGFVSYDFVHRRMCIGSTNN